MSCCVSSKYSFKDFFSNGPNGGLVITRHWYNGITGTYLTTTMDGVVPDGFPVMDEELAAHIAAVEAGSCLPDGVLDPSEILCTSGGSLPCIALSTADSGPVKG